jgi:phage shock protein C
MASRRSRNKSRSGRSKRSRPSPKVRRLHRSGNDKIIAGVCGGIAEYFNVDPVLVRLLWVIGSLAWGAGFLAYIIAWIIMPRNPDHKW